MNMKMSPIIVNNCILSDNMEVHYISEFIPSMKYLLRIMKVLKTHNHLTVTNIAMLSRINHKRCRAHIEWLEQKGYVTMKVLKGKKNIILTSSGLHYADKLLSVNHSAD